MNKKPVLHVLAGKSLTVPPVWIMRQAGRYLPEYKKIRASLPSFLDLCYTPEKAAEVTLQPIRRFSLDASIIFSDILVIPHALGQKLEYLESKGPVLDAITDLKKMPEFSEAKLLKHLAPVGEAIERVVKELPKHTTMIGFAGSPWTVATYMIEGGTSKNFIKARAFAYNHPQAFAALLSTLCEATVSYLTLQVKAGAECVQLFDSWSGIVPEAQFDAWVIKPTAAIVSAFKKRYPNTPVIGFPRGAGRYYARYIQQTGVDALGIDETQNIGALSLPLPLQGNFDPAYLLTDKETIKSQVQKIKKSMQGKPHIFNLGHGIVPETPIAHVEHFIAAIRE